MNTKHILVLFAFLLAFTSCEENKERSITLAQPEIYNVTNLKANSFKIEYTQIVNAQSYEISLATDESFTELVSPYESVSVKDDNYSFTDLQANQTYYVRVTAEYQELRSESSVAEKVTTLVADDVEPDTALKEVAESFHVGMAVITERLNGTHHEIYQREYNQITAEWEMKMNIMYPTEGRYDFTAADQLVDYAEANGMRIHGHALIWHAATPTWVEDFAGTDEEFETMVEDYIKTTVSRYKGRIVSWDVVNEAVNDSNGELRNTVFLQRMGADYIQKCFQWAREADPDVLLFYNDYNLCWDQTKLGTVLNLIDDFQTNNVPLDGVGFQMHISYNGPSKARIAENTKLVTDKGVLLHYSELDVKVNPDNDISELTEERAFAQKDKVTEVVEIYNAIPEGSKFALTIWGLRDNESWIPNQQGHADWALFYDEDFNIKKAHTGFLEGLE
ncbi:endo-1,4-beta-xylanase [Sediminitomix flava]|uniref:Beta-xylanase n=1 Tax=Sediminitomix flava TaxID=379075 RepID=A0A315Z9P1_SEDFL|nr:endo-1,4-beta-xylanase [Sediminitomix flava]PWJ41909.1 endo-1,4-beta-xylanase [Sediminitomix flava]